jgi:hypothetical protein
MFRLLRLLLGSLGRLLYSRRDRMLENLALRQQLALLKTRNQRPRLSAPDKLFWVLARRFWAGWRKALLVLGLRPFLRHGRIRQSTVRRFFLGDRKFLF